MEDEIYTQGGTKYPPKSQLQTDYRVSEQNKCVEEYIKTEFGSEGMKWDCNEKYFRWIKSGLAEKFAEAFDDNLSHDEILRKMKA